MVIVNGKSAERRVNSDSYYLKSSSLLDSIVAKNTRWTDENHYRGLSFFLLLIAVDSIDVRIRLFGHRYMVEPQRSGSRTP